MTFCRRSALHWPLPPVSSSVAHREIALIRSIAMVHLSSKCFRGQPSIASVFRDCLDPVQKDQIGAACGCRCVADRSDVGLAARRLHMGTRLTSGACRGMLAFLSRPASRRQHMVMVVLAHIRDQSRLSLDSYPRANLLKTGIKDTSRPVCSSQPDSFSARSAHVRLHRNQVRDPRLIAAPCGTRGVDEPVGQGSGRAPGCRVGPCGLRKDDALGSMVRNCAGPRHGCRLAVAGRRRKRTRKPA